MGLSWLVLAYALWLGLFKPNSTILIFSMRDVEAMDLLKNRIGGMYDELPEFLQHAAESRSNHLIKLTNGSSFQAFATTAGRSYTASFVIVDEADFIPTLSRLITAVKPTIDAQGKLVLVSTSDKDEPNSAFKVIFRGSQNGQNDYKSIFLSWRSRPDRDDTWYEKQKRGGYTQDDLYQEYPATIAQALMGRMASKRFPLEWVKNRGVGGHSRPCPIRKTNERPQREEGRASIWRQVCNSGRSERGRHNQRSEPGYHLQ